MHLHCTSARNHNKLTARLRSCRAALGALMASSANARMPCLRKRQASAALTRGSKRPALMQGRGRSGSGHVVDTLLLHVLDYGFFKC
jgi:hypothetical protein